MSEQFTPDLNLKGLPDAIRERLYSGKKKDFCYQGIWIFSGSQGSGKTLLLMEAVKQMEHIATDVMQLDVMNEDAMQYIGLNNFDVVIVAIGESLEASIMATMYAKEKGVKTVIAKAIGTPQKKLLEKVGADKVLMPERDSGQRLAISLVTSNVLEYITVSDKFGIAEIGVVDKWVDKTLQDANIRAKYGINVVAIKRGSDVIVTPPPDIKILETDTLVVIGENANIAKFS